MIDLDALERAAQAATRPEGFWWDDKLLNEKGDCLFERDRRHIAAASPQAVLALVRIARAAVAWRNGYRDEDGLSLKKLHTNLLDALREAGL